MAKLLSYYKLLNVGPGASLEELKQAYRRQALRYHPDTKNDGASAALFLLIKNAYETLSDPEQRGEVDSFVRTSGALKAGPALAARPGSIPPPPLSPFENDLNYLLWDFDDLVQAPDFPRAFEPAVLDFLTFLDKGVLLPATFTSSPARDAREGPRDPRTYIDFFLKGDRRIPCEFRSVQDYFFDVKHRGMAFQSWTDRSPMSQIKGARLLAKLDAMREELLHNLMRSQRIGFYYLFEFERVKKGLKPAVDPFVHDQGR